MIEKDLASLADRTGFSVDAVQTMLDSVAAGHGRMAQFDHPEFGGFGQWMRGGMIMLATGFDDTLRHRVAGLCDALAAWVDESVARRSSQSQSQSSGAAPGTHPTHGGAWWPQSLGAPDASGSQDGMRYAWFADARRLAVDDGGQLTVYDTGDHRVGGVSQQQGGSRDLSFTGQHGRIDLALLPVVGPERGGDDPAPPKAAAPSGRNASTGTTDPFVALEKLGALYAGGVLTDAEFTAKKAELLKQI